MSPCRRGTGNLVWTGVLWRARFETSDRLLGLNLFIYFNCTHLFNLEVGPRASQDWTARAGFCYLHFVPKCCWLALLTPSSSPASSVCTNAKLGVRAAVTSVEVEEIPKMKLLNCETWTFSMWRTWWWRSIEDSAVFGVLLCMLPILCATKHKLGWNPLWFTVAGSDIEL